MAKMEIKPVGEGKYGLYIDGELIVEAYDKRFLAAHGDDIKHKR